jgi:hypothetical protein
MAAAFIIKCTAGGKSQLWVAATNSADEAIARIRRKKAVPTDAALEDTGWILRRDHQLQIGLTDGNALPLAE